MIQFEFWKYHGIGNDFIVVDALASELDWTPSLAVSLCDRHLGIGADGVLLLVPPSDPSGSADFRMIIFNADGSRPEMCGNGLRCFARYLVEQEYTTASTIKVETDRGVLACDVLADDQVRIEMGAPILECSDIPMLGIAGQCIEQPIVCDGDELLVTAVSMGNPHAIFFDWTPEQQRRLAPQLEAHSAFPQRTNVEFVTIHGPSSLEVIVYERGCGYTQACGTGACAAAVAAMLAGRIPTQPSVDVRLPGGLLHIEVHPELANVWLRGPAVSCFHGTWVGPLAAAN